MSRSGVPSRLARVLIRILVPRKERDFFLGDLEEIFRRGEARGGAGGGPAGGRRSVLREILGVLRLRFYLSAAPHPPRRIKEAKMLADLLQDVRFGWRTMVRSPGFTLVALVTLTLGIGANTAMFSLVHGILLKPLPYPEAERIVYLRETNQERGWASYNVSPPNFWDWEAMNRTLDLLAAFRTTTVTRTGSEYPEVLAAHQVSEDYMDILGGEPSLGRGITDRDLVPDGERVVVLSHGFWQRAFGEDPGALGRTLVLDGIRHTVVGVTPEGWRPVPDGADVFLPLIRNPSWLTRRTAHFLSVMGRMAPGVTLDQAQQDLSSVAAGLARALPDTNGGSNVLVRPLERVILGSSGTQLLILLGVAGMVLLIACANLANMTLAKATGRGREFAIRVALGAGRRRVLRQLLVESMLMSLLGGALGVALAHLALGGFLATWPNLLPRQQEVGISLPVLFFTGGLALGSGILFGLAPAVIASESGSGTLLRQGTRSIAGGAGGRWMRRGLVVAEVAMAVVLLIGSGLLVKSFSALREENPGFLTDERLVFSTQLPLERYQTPGLVRAFSREALDRIEAVPGVESVGVTSLVPMTGADEVYPISFEGRPPESSTGVSALLYRVSGDFLETMGVPLLAGREIGPEDREGGTPVAVVTQSFADRNFPSESPLGRRIRFGGNPAWAEIVGVVGDIQHYQVGQESLAQIYVPFDQEPTRRISFVLRASLPPDRLVPGLREAIGQVDPEQPLADIRTAKDLISGSISLSRFQTILMTGFGLTALLLAVVGLYGIVAYGVSRRTREMGIRVALGAGGNSILRLILQEGLSMVGLGLGLGVAVALALTGLLRSLLFKVGETDPVVFAVVPGILVAAALAAMLIPALRATRLDPVQTLGEE